MLAIWTPLFESLFGSFRGGGGGGTRHVCLLRTALSSHIVARLLEDRHHHHQRLACPDDEATAAERTSYELCLAGWGAWLVEWRIADETDADVSARRQDVFFQLIHAMCASCPRGERTTTTGTPLACQPGFVMIFQF